jgi:lipid A 3-O-deacylase
MLALKATRYMLWPKLFSLSAITLIAVSATAFADVGEDPRTPSKRTLLFHSGVSGLFDGEKNPTVALEYRFGNSLLELQPWLGAGWATDGAVFVAAGVAHTWQLGRDWNVGAGFGPGYYDRHEGLDLGSRMEFYSFVELTRQIRTGQNIVVRLAHISNGGLADSNPGTELLSLGYSIQLP